MLEAQALKAKVKSSPPEPKAEETGLRPMAETAVATSTKAAATARKGVDSDTESTKTPLSSAATTGQNMDEATKGIINRYFEEKLEDLKEADIEGLERFLDDTINVRDVPGIPQSSLKCDFQNFIKRSKLVPENRYAQYTAAVLKD